MNFHLVTGEVNGDICVMNEIIHEILFDHIALVTKTDDELVKPVLAVNFHDMPEDGFAPNFNHWFGAYIRLFRDPGAQAAGKYDNFH